MPGAGHGHRHGPENRGLGGVIQGTSAARHPGVVRSPDIFRTHAHQPTNFKNFHCRVMMVACWCTNTRGLVWV